MAAVLLGFAVGEYAFCGSDVESCAVFLHGAVFAPWGSCGDVCPGGGACGEGVELREGGASVRVPDSGADEFCLRRVYFGTCISRAGLVAAADVCAEEFIIGRTAATFGVPRRLSDNESCL